MKTRWGGMLLASYLLCACAERGPSGKDGASAHVAVSAEAAGERCPNGGQRLEASVGSGPVTTTWLCNGGEGQAGSPAQVTVMDEPAGTNCATGGKRLETAVGEGPVTISYLCNGEAGAGAVAVSEPPGAHCPAGGVKVTTANGDAFVCNGVDGQDVTVTPEPPGTHCPSGGLLLTSAASTTYVCNGESPTVTLVAEPAGPNCPSGGQRVTASSAAGTTTAFVCNGATARVAITPEPAGANCPAGGFKLVTFVDANGNGALDTAEMQSAGLQYLCNGTSPDGGTPTQACTGAYEALQWDGTAWQCVRLDRSGPSAGRARGYELVDPWGTAWDGVERMAATWPNAKAACEAVGGRLPTATEAWRVGASQSATVGTPYEGNSLWTLTPWHVNGATQQHTLAKLNDPGGDSSISFANDSTPSPFRCVWPDPGLPPGFSGNRCHGPAGSACFQAVGDGRRLNLDTYDRPSLTYAGASWECAFYGAHLPLSRSLAENIVNGLPNGSNAWVWTSDHPHYAYADVLRWSGTHPAGWNATYPSNWSWASRSNPTRYRFRCMGDGRAPQPNPATPGDLATWGAPFTGASTSLVSHSNNLPAAKWEHALTDCFSRGGQLPHTRDWMELIRDGLPNGAGTAGTDYAWSSDWSSLAYAQVIRWAGVDRDYTGYYSQYGTWSALGAKASPYRCAWYPLDASYAGPGLCNGGQFSCFVSEKNPGDFAARTWADPVDRAPASWIAALTTCAAEGGHLASLSEYVALVRDGLPNGQGPSLQVWSSDSVGNDGTNPALAGLFTWGGGVNGTQTDWSTDPSSTGWAYRDTATPYGYRCVWSNQVW